MFNTFVKFYETFIACYFFWGILLCVASILLLNRKFLIICKTLPRDLRLCQLVFKAASHLNSFKRNNFTILDLLEFQTKKNPKKPLFYYKDQIWTFEEVFNFSNKIGNIFYKENYGEGDVVALLMGNCPEYVGIWLGLGKIGAITALINTNLKYQSLVHCLKASKAKAIIYDEEFESNIKEISEEIRSLKKYRWGTRTCQTEQEITNLRSLFEYASNKPASSNVKIGFKNKILYIYTSGTTGLPKAAIIHHHRLLVISAAMHCLLGVTEDDIIYNPLPMYHTAGGLVGIVGPISYGFSTVIKKKFSASSYWPDCIKYNCTVALYIGEMCRYIMMVPSRPEDTQHGVRIMLGNGMKISMWRNFQERFNIENICELYGSTEGNTNLVNIDKTVGAVGFFPKIVPESWLPMALIRVDEFNKPLRNFEGFCIRCKPNEPGLLVGMITDTTSREYSGYVGDKKESEKKIIKNLFKKGDKAFLSGDILAMDELGYLYFKDRTGDTFRWKGENVSTAEVEGIISSILGLRDVIVYGVQVGSLEGRAGMATIFDPSLNLDLKHFETEIDRQLPPYARPLFLRLTERIDLTGTFKLIKLNFQKEGFNPNIIKDKLYFKNGNKCYVELTQKIYDDIICERVKI